MSKPKVRLNVAGVVGLLFVGVVLLMNLNPGHLGFRDDDGCSCTVSYTTHPPNPACERTRPAHCDQWWLSHLVARFSFLDFNP